MEPEGTTGERDTVRELRERAAALRADPAPGPDSLPVAADDVDDPSATPPFSAGEAGEAGEAGGIGDQLLDRWADDDLTHALEPERNWSVLVVPVVVVLALGLAALGGRFLINRSAESDARAGGPRGEDAVAAQILAEDPPSLADLTADITVPPGPEIGLQVIEQGVTVVEDRFDEARREATFGLVIENPNLDQLAQGVQIEVSFIDDDGEVIATDDAFVEVVLPGARVAVAALVFDAPTATVAELDVVLDVARWRETEPIPGSFEFLEFETVAAEFSGVRTSFELRSDFERSLEDVAVTAIYRRVDGTIIGGADTFLELLEPDTPTSGDIVLLANVDVDDVASTELYVTPSFGSVPSR